MKNGHIALGAWVVRQQRRGSGPPGFVFSVVELARVIGVSRQVLRMWLLGAVTPDATHQERIEEATAGGVPAKVWRVSRARRAP